MSRTTIYFTEKELKDMLNGKQVEIKLDNKINSNKLIFKLDKEKNEQIRR